MVATDENMCPNTVGVPDIFYLPEEQFASLKAKFASGSGISVQEADSLVNWTIKNNEIVIPVDMNGAGESLDDFDGALKLLGANKIMECFMKAEKYFEETKKHFAEAECPKPITAGQWKKDNDEEDDEDELPMYKPDLFHVPKKAFEAIKQKLSSRWPSLTCGKEELSKQEVDELVNWTAPDSEILVPVDMNGTDEDLDDFDEMLDKLGPRKIAECFVQAEKHFEKKRHLIQEDKCKEITISQWKSSEFNEEENEEEEEKPDEDAEDDDEEEDEDEGEDEDDDEPTAKKPRS